LLLRPEINLAIRDCDDDKVLRERLVETLRLAELRERTLYKTTTIEDIAPTLPIYRAFVDLCERVEKESDVLVKIIV
jgi:hypothetical protein